MSSQPHDIHAASGLVPAWNYMVASGVVLPVLMGVVFIALNSQMPPSTVASASSASSSSSSKSKSSSTKESVDDSKHESHEDSTEKITKSNPKNPTIAMTERTSNDKDDVDENSTDSVVKPESKNKIDPTSVVAAQKQAQLDSAQKALTQLNAERATFDKSANDLKNQILQARQTQLETCNSQAKKLASEFDSHFQDAFNISDIKKLIRLKSTDPKTFKKMPIDPAELTKNFNQQVTGRCYKSLDAHKRNFDLSEKNIQDRITQLIEINQRLTSLGGKPIPLPSADEQQLDELEATRKRIREIPIPQYSIAEFKTALGGDTDPEPDTSVATTDTPQPTTPTKTQPKDTPLVKPVSEWERVLQTKGFKADFKEIRVSTVLTRIKELAQSNTITFECSEDVGKERVSLTVANKSIQNILDEIAKQIKGKLVQKDTILKIVKSTAGKKEVEDTGKRIKGIIGR